jgi:hypothetical protein
MGARLARILELSEIWHAAQFRLKKHNQGRDVQTMKAAEHMLPGKYNS